MGVAAGAEEEKAAPEQCVCVCLRACLLRLLSVHIGCWEGAGFASKALLNRGQRVCLGEQLGQFGCLVSGL